MQCWYISLNTSLNELTRRNKTLVEDYHLQLSRKCLLLSRLFRLLRKRSGISGKYMDKKASLKFRKETTVRYRSAICGIDIVNLPKINDGHAILEWNWKPVTDIRSRDVYTPACTTPHPPSSKELNGFTRFEKNDLWESFLYGIMPYGNGKRSPMPLF